jgi:hypothetical protein
VLTWMRAVAVSRCRRGSCRTTAFCWVESWIASAQVRSLAPTAPLLSQDGLCEPAQLPHVELKHRRWLCCVEQWLYVCQQCLGTEASTSANSESREVPGERAVVMVTSTGVPSECLCFLVRWGGSEGRWLCRAPDLALQAMILSTARQWRQTQQARHMCGSVSGRSMTYVIAALRVTAW